LTTNITALLALFRLTADTAALAAIPFPLSRGPRLSYQCTAILLGFYSPYLKNLL